MKTFKPRASWRATLAKLGSLFVLLLAYPRIIQAQSPLVISEILADNRMAVPNGDSFSDYIELFNSSAQTINLASMSLTDDLSQPRKYVFPPNTLLAGGGFLLVWCDGQTNAPGFHANFNLNTKGETVGLYNADGAMQDLVTFGLQLPDFSLGRMYNGANGTSSWTLAVPTPGLPNIAQPLGLHTALKINEWMANAAPDPDWIELFNATHLPVSIGGLVFTDKLSMNPTNRPIPALSFIEANGAIQFLADDLAVADADHLDFKLNSATGETITLFDERKTTILDRVTFGSQTLNVSQGRLPDGGTNIVFFPSRPTPAASNFLPVTNVVINELLTHTDPPLEDAVELFNPTAQPADIGNWWLSNHRDDPMRYRIPAGTIIPAGGYKVIYENQFDYLRLGFTFNSYESGEVVLFSADASGALTGYRLQQAFEPSANGVAFGRFQTSRGVDFVPMRERTFGVDSPASPVEFRAGTGKTNSYPLIGPVIINELMYHPPDLVVGGMPVENTEDEYIELFNATNRPTPLFDPLYPTNQWRIRKSVSFDFPPNLAMPAQSYLLIVSFNPSNTALLDDFRNKYKISNEVSILGPYIGKLGNRSNTVELLRPDAPQALDRPKPGLVPYLLVDRLDHEDRDPWPVSPDGGGHSLQRRSAIVYGNDPVHWLGAPPTPGRANAIEPPKIESPAVSASGLFQFQFTARAGVAYTAEWQTNLVGSAAQSLTNIAAALFDRKIDVSDLVTTNKAERFFRIRLPVQH